MITAPNGRRFRLVVTRSEDLPRGAVIVVNNKVVRVLSNECDRSGRGVLRVARPGWQWVPYEYDTTHERLVPA